MINMFQLTTFHDMYLVTVLAAGEPIDRPLYLCHQHDNLLGWTSDKYDAKRFQYKIDAIEYVLRETRIRRYREAVKGDVHIEVQFDTQQVIVASKTGPLHTLPFSTAKAIHDLPIFRKKQPTEERK